MEDRFELLTCNDDLISFQEDTFKVGKFMEQLSKEFYRREGNHEISHLACISINQLTIRAEINWQSNLIDFELLRLGSPSWQKGKVRCKVRIKTVPNEREVQKKLQIQLDLEFYPDEPPISEPESPLDDLRQMINQETQQ